MRSAWASIKCFGLVAPIALSCVMHQSTASGSEAATRRDQELQRLSISARSQMMTFSRAIWLRERGSPRSDACLWRLWESDWTAIRRTSVASLPAWCRDVTADSTAEESRHYAITCLHSHAVPQSLRDATVTDASPSVRLDVSMQPATSPSTPVIASPSLAIQRSLDETPPVVVAIEAWTRLSQASRLGDRADQAASGIISSDQGGLLN